jgi:hypothetical protein
MSKENWSNILSLLARTGLAFVFAFGQTAWAGQGQNVKEKPGSSAGPKSQQAPSNFSTSTGGKAQLEETGPAVAEASSEQEGSQHRGQHEAIKVHGHWSIEVHNPDGSLVRHVEFENSLDPGFTVPGQNGQAPTAVPGGAAYLSALLAGQWAAPGLSYGPFNGVANWFILLLGPGGLNQPPSSTAAPCNNSGFPISTSCTIYQNVQPCGVVGPGTSCNLSVLPLGSAPNFTGLQLTGSVVATQNGQVSGVATLLVGVSCLPGAPSCSVPDSRNMTSFTSSSNFPGAPISVVANQTLAVTVNITFS